MSRSITDLIHHPYQPPAGFVAPPPAVHKASTLILPNVAAMRSRDWKSKAGYTYGLHGTPTTFVLEERIAALDGGLQCILVPSGLASIALTAMALLQTGDEVLIPDNAYGPNKALAEGELKNWGITHQFYDPMHPQDLRSRMTAKTRLVWLEAPGSVTMEFPPLAQLAAICREKGVLSALDNTWAGGIAFNGFDLGPADARVKGNGADIVVHALTKYPSGGGDVLMGAVTTRDEALHLKLKGTHMRMGWGIAGNDAEAVLRSLPTLPVRYHAQDVTARVLASWLQGRPEVAQLLHPAFENSPGHAHWKETCGEQGAAAGLFSVVFQERFSAAQVDAFCDALKLFKLGYSWGGPVSLVVPYDIRAMRTPRPGNYPYQGVLVRFSTGFEAAGDLRADLEQALSRLA
jgi:cystathionine beta-lyase